MHCTAQLAFNGPNVGIACILFCFISDIVVYRDSDKYEDSEYHNDDHELGERKALLVF